MKDYRQIDGMIKQMDECLHHAYDRGYNKGIADGNINDGTFAEKVSEAYNNGLRDAWNCAREISLLDSNSASVEEMKNILKVFGTDNIYDILHDYTPQDAIKRIKDYEERDLHDKCKECVHHSKAPNLFCGRCVEFSEYEAKEVQVGDEVYNLDPENVRVVTAIYYDDKGYKQAVQICKNGKYAVDRVDTLTKTGKHYDGIESILDQMKGRKNERFNKWRDNTR